MGKGIIWGRETEQSLEAFSVWIKDRGIYENFVHRRCKREQMKFGVRQH